MRQMMRSFPALFVWRWRLKEQMMRRMAGMAGMPDMSEMGENATKMTVPSLAGGPSRRS